MPNQTITYSNPESLRPNIELMPAALRGWDYSNQMRDYENALDLQKQMQLLGLEKTRATQPNEIFATNQENLAKGTYAMPDAGFKSEGLRLGNEKTRGDIRSTDLENQSKQYKQVLEQIDSAVNAASAIGAAGGGPAELAQLRERLGPMGNKLADFLLENPDPNERQNRATHLMNMRKELDMKYQIALLGLKEAQARSAGSNKPGDWERYYNVRVRELMTSGRMSREQAEFQANREMAGLKVKEGGVSMPSPTQRGEEQGAEDRQGLAARLEAIAGLSRSPEQAKRLRDAAEALRSTAGGPPASAPGLQPPTPAAQPARPIPQAAKAMPIEQARQFLKDPKNNTPANRLFFERTYGEKP